MKLRELLQQMKEVTEKIGTSEPFLCGGTPRDRYMKRLDNISDVDITTGDKTVQYLAQEFGGELAKQYNVTRRNHDDGHSSIYIGSFKMDFSSNYNTPNIDALLAARGIQKPTEMQKEMFSRDFTCNALLLSLDLKKLSDPTKLAFTDIKDKVIRTCLAPEITLTSNKNRVIRAVYLASKLDFDIDQSIIEFVQKNPSSVKIASEKVLTEKLNEAFNRDPDKASYYIGKMRIWGEIPITEVVRPYYMKQSNNKVAYFQGGGGVNEPTPKKKKYKSDPAIVNQTRFKEPFYRNYDVYDVPGFEHIGPGAGWHSMQKYKSISEFLKAKRKKMKDKYKADDSWIQNNGEVTKKDPNIKARAMLLNRIVKTARMPGMGLFYSLHRKFKNDEHTHEKCLNCGNEISCKCMTNKIKMIDSCSFCKKNADYMLSPKEHGTKIYDWKNSPYQGIPKAPKKHDSNDIDFPIDDQIGSGVINFNEETVQSPWYLGPEGPPGDMSSFPNNPNLGDETTYPHSVEMGGEVTFPWPDEEGKTPVELDFGRDYTNDTKVLDKSKVDISDIEKLLDKYLSHGTYGLPDGVDMPEEDLNDPSDLNPEYGTVGPDSLMYEDKWNI